MIQTLLIGKNGQIGWELHQNLLSLPLQVIALSRSELDVTDPQAVREAHEALRPQIVINATGYNNVDAAEQQIAAATAVNVAGNENLAQAARQVNAFYISFSTDYVFDGRKGSAYVETDAPNPLNNYGRTKLAGERIIQESGANHLIIRTSSVFSDRRPCFVSNFLQQARTTAQVRVRTDLVSSPTSARFLAQITARIISMGEGDPVGFLKERAGMYQLAGAGAASRYEWAEAIVALLQLDTRLVPASAQDFLSSPPRPAYSALDCSKFGATFQVQPVTWHELLKTTLKEIS